MTIRTRRTALKTSRRYAASVTLMVGVALLLVQGCTTYTLDTNFPGARGDGQLAARMTPDTAGPNATAPAPPVYPVTSSALPAAPGVTAAASAAGTTVAAKITEARPWVQVARLTDPELDSMRGGFVITAGGILLHIGLEISTFVDGVLLSNFSFDNDINENAPTSTAGSPPDTFSNTSFKNIIQVGPGNRVDLGTSFLNFGGVATVIQNSLSDTVIQHITALNIDVKNSSKFFKRAFLLRSLNPAIINSLP